jgi:hypothetical protein
VKGEERELFRIVIMLEIKSSDCQTIALFVQETFLAIRSFIKVQELIDV